MDLFTSQMFDEWFEYTKDSDNFKENIGFYDHLESEFEENFRSIYYDMDAVEFKKKYEIDLNNEIKIYAQDWFDDRLADFHYDTSKLVFHGEFIEMYREITVPNIHEFIHDLKNGKIASGYKGIGVCWAFDKSRACAHWSQSSEKVLLTAYVHISNILLKESFLLNFDTTLGEDEAELRIKDGIDVQIIKINEIEFDEPILINS